MEKRIRENRRPDEADLFVTGPRLPDELTRWTMYLMSRAVQRGWVLLATRLEAEGFSPRVHALLAVVNARAPISQQSISELLRVDRTTMIGIADAAEASGWISRDRDREDRRKYALRLTEDGERALALADGLVADAHADLLGELDDDERTVLHGLLRRIVPAAGDGFSNG